MINQKYDFAVVIEVKNANPNGDPLNGNRPRISYDGFGEITDVCLKRKIRNRWIDTKESVFVQSDDKKIDEYNTLRARAEGKLEKKTLKDKELLYSKACETWIDVRAFGQVFAFTGGDAKGVSVGVRGPVSIQSAYSVHPVNITSTQITKSVNNEKEGGKSSDTMGMKHRIDYGVYVAYGSINAQLAEKTGFSDDDALKLKEALATLFENDASSARPEGSMRVRKLYWWQHEAQYGKHSSYKVHESLSVKPKAGIIDVKSMDDIDIVMVQLDGLMPEVIEG
jgi:CRISPR-associated protein Csd2